MPPDRLGHLPPYPAQGAGLSRAPRDDREGPRAPGRERSGAIRPREVPVRRALPPCDRPREQDANGRCAADRPRARPGGIDLVCRQRSAQWSGRRRAASPFWVWRSSSTACCRAAIRLFTTIPCRRLRQRGADFPIHRRAHKRRPYALLAHPPWRPFFPVPFFSGSIPTRRASTTRTIAPSASSELRRRRRSG